MCLSFVIFSTLASYWTAFHPSFVPPTRHRRHPNQTAPLWTQKHAFWSLQKIKGRCKTYEETTDNVRSQVNDRHMSLPSFFRGSHT
jgi:hypothetical protein